LGLVVTAEALRTLSADPAQAQRLGAIAGELWKTGSDLLPGEVGA
jgi:hypothetical protein